jgi:hypothetical protein
VILYAKLFTSIYQGTLRGNSHGLLVFTNLIAHCDKDGVVDMHPRAIAEEVGLTVEQVKVALEELERPDEESRSPEEQGRRIVRLDEHRAWGWRVVNYCKYRAIRNEEDRREQNRLSQDRWRKAHKQSSASVSQDKPPSAEVSPDKPQSAHTEADAEADTESKPAPRKRGRSAAPTTIKAEDLALDGVTLQTARDWLTLRHAKRLPLTLTAWNDVKAEGVKAGLSPAETVSAAVANNWSGFKASWLERKAATDRSNNGRHDIFAGLER